VVSHNLIPFKSCHSERGASLGGIRFSDLPALPKKLSVWVEEAFGSDPRKAYPSWVQEYILSPAEVGAMPFNEGLFWVGITVFGTGLYFVIEKASRGIRWFAGFTAICGLATTCYSIYAHTHPNFPMPSSWVYLVGLTWVLVGADFYSRRQRNIVLPESDKSSITPNSQTVTMSVEQLIALFRRGETTIDGQRLVKPYIRMRLTVSGEIADVRESCITFKGRSFTSNNGVSTYFSKKNRDRLSILRPGNVVTVTGDIERISEFAVDLDNCEIAN